MSKGKKKQNHHEGEWERRGRDLQMEMCSPHWPLCFQSLLNQFRNSQHKSVKNVIKSRSGRERSNKQTNKPNVQAFRMKGRKEGSWRGEWAKKNNCLKKKRSRTEIPTEWGEWNGAGTFWPKSASN
jgi:hypothetical protein